MQPTNLTSQSDRAPEFTHPSVSGARYWAREHALARMRGFGRHAPNSDDNRFLHTELARLLFMVEAADGGFLGLDDLQRERRARELGLSDEIVAGAAYRGGVWPASERIAA